MPVHEIPLNPYPENFSVVLDDSDYSFSTVWNVPTSTWLVSITTLDGVPVITSLPLIPGVDLLAQYPTLGFKGQLIAQVDHDQSAVPSYSGLGTSGHLYYITP